MFLLRSLRCSSLCLQWERCSILLLWVSPLYCRFFSIFFISYFLLDLWSFKFSARREGVHLEKGRACLLFRFLFLFPSSILLCPLFIFFCPRKKNYFSSPKRKWTNTPLPCFVLFDSCYFTPAFSFFQFCWTSSPPFFFFPYLRNSLL